MKNLKKMAQRSLAVVLALVMCVGMLSMNAFAALISGEQFTVNVVKVVNGNAVETVTLTTTCLQSTGHSGYNHSTNLRNLANTSGFSGYKGYNWSKYTTVPSSYTSGLCPNNNYASVHYNITGSAPYRADETLFLFFETTKTFTLNYNANGGSGAPAQQTATTTETSHNFTVSSTIPTRDGYNFLGWSTSSTAASASYQGGGSINVTGTTTLYAVWEKVPEVQKVTLTYMDRGMQYAQQTYDKGATVTVGGCTNTRNGYTFQGWDTSSAAETAVYSADDTFTINANTTLYAVWEKNEPVTPPEPVVPTDNGNGISITKTRTSAAEAKVGDTITWDIVVTNNSNVEKTVTLTEIPGVTLSKSSVTLAAGASETVTASYTVTGEETLTEGKFYNTVSATTGDTGDKENPSDTDDGTEIKKDDEPVTPPAESQYTFKIVYKVLNADDDGTVANMPETYVATSNVNTHDANVSAQIPTREGYTFSHWTIGPAGARRDPGDTHHFNAPEAKPGYNATETVYLYAHWTKNPEPQPEPVQVTVTWVDEDGTTVLDGPKTFNKGEAEPTTDVVPTKAEDENYTYEFDKWERSEDEDGNVTYRATYTATPKPEPEPEPEQVTVTWVDEDGATVLDGPKSFTKGEDEPTTDVTPTKAEDANYTYEFDKWERSEDEDGNVTYRATYTATPKPAPVVPDPIPVIPDPDPVIPDPDPEEIEEPDVPLAEEPGEEIEEPDVPLADLPEPEPDEEIEEPDVPMADVPQTGDSIGIWAGFALISAAGLVWLALEDRKRKTSAK